jgi:hypothetical protein
MRPHEIIAQLTPERCEEILTRISAEAPDVFRQTVASAAAALKFRPQYLAKQPLPKRIASIRRVLVRPASGPLAEELLAVYFLRCRLDLLREWLDLVGLEHEDGVLTADEVPCPDASLLEEKVKTLRSGEDPDCELLLRVFAAQSAIDWPALDEILARPAS